ncbi:galactose metabolism-related protein [Paramarasmius palmivorus]|uniref:Galactose metabolism-related protein n=1 Tax=Paramarasmius palmivorus TaxID=297713 RepID=A0AAW0BR32_9AGAR
MSAFFPCHSIVEAWKQAHLSRTRFTQDHLARFISTSPAFIVERYPQLVSYVAVGTSTPTEDDHTITSIPRDDSWPSTSPTLRIFEDRHGGSNLSIVTSATRSDTESSWDELSDDDEDPFQDVYYDCFSQPSSPTSPISPTPIPTRSYEPTWTDQIPLELIEAAREEHSYLSTALREQSEALENTAVSLPDVPVPPELPRFLDRPVISPSLQRHAGRRHSVVSTMATQAPDRLDLQQGYFVTSGGEAVPGVGRAIAIDGVGHEERGLPVPTHAVIQHLCTSAIKHGVLGVAVTYRYRNKVRLLRSLVQ